MRVDPYDRYAYAGVTIPYTAPAHIALCARWSQGCSPNTESFSAAELGCGDGGNLLPLAFYNPESAFVGIDSSRQAVKRAQDGANRLGLQNVRYICCDVRDLAAIDFPQFDYIIAHGLYSWVPDDARAAILAFCRGALASDGLAYICITPNQAGQRGNSCATSYAVRGRFVKPVSRKRPPRRLK